jgi:hypothetical protein
MRIKINYKTIFQYFLIYIMMLSQGSVLYLMDKMVFSYVVLGICVITMLFCKQTRANNYIVVFIGMLLLNIVITRIVSGGVGIKVFIKWFAEILLAYVTYKYDDKNFVSRFVKFVYYYALISLGFYTLCFVNPNFVQSITPFHIANPNYGYTVFDGLLLYIFRPLDLARNVGLYGEPGLYQIVLNSALFLEFFYNRNGDKNNRKRREKTIFVLVITIITTQSTTGYFGMLIILFFYIFLQHDSSKKKIVALALIGIVFVFINYISLGDDSLLSKNLLQKIFDNSGNIDLSVSTGANRLLMIEIGLESIMRNPFGS